MKILTPGHRYECENFVAKNDPGQIIQFIEKAHVFDCKPGEDPVPTGELTLVNDGTTNEEVIEVLIDRLETMYAKFPSPETKDAIEDLRDAKYRLELRTANRKARGVEGKAVA